MDDLKVKSFIQAAPFESRLMNTFFLKLENEPDETLIRINPVLFAEKHGLDAKKVVDIFILAARAGIFNLFFQLVCPTCGLILLQDTSLHGLNKSFHFCAVCNIDVPVVLDDTIEVVFQIQPAIYKIQASPFQTAGSFNSFFFSRKILQPDGKTEASGTIMDDFTFLSPGHTKVFTLDAKLITETDASYRLVAINLNISFLMYIGDQSGHNAPLQLTVNEMGFSQKKVHLNRGDIKVELTNNSGGAIGICFVKPDQQKNNPLLQDGTPQFAPFLNGKILFTNTTFRNLFRIRDLPVNLKLELRSLTLLFMELKSSNDLYDENGDAFIYDLTQKNLYKLEEIADRYQGAIIKIMGDSIMVSFPQPAESLLAALSMLEQIKSFTYRDSPALHLKIGLHEGHALVINRDDRLDYFGRTVTLAALLRELAGPGEIFFSDTIFRNREIKRELMKQKDKIKLFKKRIKLKEMAKQMTIYKITID